MHNYSVQAIEGLNYLSVYMTRHKDLNKDIPCLSEITKLIRAGKKFELPMSGLLFDGSKVDRPFERELLRLPYPEIVLEFDVESINPNTEKTERKKRIVVCKDFDGYEKHPLVQLALASCPDLKRHGGILACIGATDVSDQWVMQPDFWVVPREEGLNKKLGDDLRGLMQSMMSQSTARIEEGFFTGLECWPVTYLPELKKLSSSSSPNLMMESYRQKREGLSILNVLGGLLSALSCKNISIEDIPAPEKLNKKRLRSGKVPLFGYKVLVIKTTDRQKVPPTQSATIQGRKSPRQHERRGHPRRYRDGTRTWIAPMIVGSDGKIEKTYRLT